MSKVRNFSEIAPNIAFPEFNFYELYYSTFEKSELGRIKKVLPLCETVENIGLIRKSMRPKLGRKSFFTSEGKVALMFLKMYMGTQLSETAGTTELQHPLPDILRRDNRSDTPIDKLQAVGRHNDGGC